MQENVKKNDFYALIAIGRDVARGVMTGSIARRFLGWTGERKSW